MATQVMGQASGGKGLSTGSSSIVMELLKNVYNVHDLSKAEMATPQLIMLANVALTGEVNGSCCDYLIGEEKQMTELTTIGDNNFSDSDKEGIEESPQIKGEPNGLINTKLRNLELSVVQSQPVFEALPAPEVYSSNKHLPSEIKVAKDKWEKAYGGELCPYSSSRKTHVARHMHTHSDENLFRCAVMWPLIQVKFSED
ncbi:RE1-silencing transcription factor-like [Nycticebus coucang]|uniref:RE1-silencing transcription factor-like n=1 Tax=Nycticebus coucang TaxID=9470 RepID=UPI00234D3E6E|nr:RE1-silencing transcription factor-like [Nycticebus coucang]